MRQSFSTIYVWRFPLPRYNLQSVPSEAPWPTASHNLPGWPIRLLPTPIEMPGEIPISGKIPHGLGRKPRRVESHAARRRRPFRRWPRYAVGLADCGQGLLRPCRRAHQLRYEVLPRLERNRQARFVADRAIARVGAVITGKTHLHPLAYGITGENPDFGDCLQPGNPDALTGGSSTGAAPACLRAPQSPPSALIQAAPFACPPRSAGSQAIARPRAAAIGEA